jgi:hypothetical protein
MTAAQALARMSVGVLVERRKAASPWIDFTWQPVSVLPGVPDVKPWTKLDGNEDRATFYAGAAEIELFRTETPNYRENLANHRALWVVLRPTGAEPPYTLYTVTADPAEGEAYTEAGNDLVDQVPMPPAVRDFVAAFVAEHAEHAAGLRLTKRKREQPDPEALARRDRIRGDDHE